MNDSRRENNFQRHKPSTVKHRNSKCKYLCRKERQRDQEIKWEKKIKKMECGRKEKYNNNQNNEMNERERKDRSNNNGQ